MPLTCPTAGLSVKVTVQGTGPGGTICAAGQNFTRGGSYTAWVKVYNSGATISSHPEGQSAVFTSQNWFFSNVPVPNSSATSPGASLIIASWIVVGTGLPDLETQPFFGLRGGGTDCCAGSGLRAVAHGASALAAPLVLAPALWSVVASGFAGGAALFNGHWLLSHREAAGDLCRWDNGGQPSLPSVELCCESPLARSWHLYFRNGAGAEVVYSVPAARWSPLASNSLHLCSGDGFPEGAVPESVTVQPG